MPSPYFSPGGEAKCVRGPSVGGARRTARIASAGSFGEAEGVADSTLSTASQRNEVMAGLLRSPTVRR